MLNIRRVGSKYVGSAIATLITKQAAWRTDPAQSGIAGAMGDIGTHALIWRNM